MTHPELEAIRARHAATNPDMHIASCCPVPVAHADRGALLDALDESRQLFEASRDEVAAWHKSWDFAEADRLAVREALRDAEAELTALRAVEQAARRHLGELHYSDECPEDCLGETLAALDRVRGGTSGAMSNSKP